MPSQYNLEHMSSIFRSPLFFAPTIAISVILAAFYIIARRNEDSSIPLYVPENSAAGNQKQRWMYDSVNLLQEAYRKFDGKPFRIWTTEGIQIVTPPNLVDELKTLPKHTFPSALRDFFQQDYIWPVDPSKVDHWPDLLKNDLNKNMERVFSDVRSEIGVVLPMEFPECQDWLPVQVYPKVLRLVSRVSGKVFVGENLHQNEEWIELSCNYTRDMFIAATKLRSFHPWLRPIAQYFIPEVRNIWKCNTRARDLVAPILRQREMQDRKLEGHKKANDAIEWLRDAVSEQDKNDPNFHGISQLVLAASSVNTTSQLITNAIFNLAPYPEHIPILREEMDSVLKEESESEWTLESMGRLQKLDSFIKETLRYNGHITATFQRKTLRPLTLSDGTYIPAGAYTFCPANAINFDPAIYPEPTAFSPLRFYKLRQTSPENEKRYQLTSITKTQMQFGNGRNACPGRWFASHLIKLVLVAVLDQYELRLKEGEGRPKTTVFQINQFPDTKAEVLFKNRNG